jgi:hypothetical protein
MFACERSVGSCPAPGQSEVTRPIVRGHGASVRSSLWQEPFKRQSPSTPCVRGGWSRWQLSSRKCLKSMSLRCADLLAPWREKVASESGGGEAVRSGNWLFATDYR